ncbi:hypothetical protein EPH95_06130 [Salicibibacter halophilus]|uniref:Uncharacterized protein n=1 Tax=Salicibibacter halophilus TaxID=2502791 RepID=A0A514LG26_9BACI|nr:hypothetical protein [Salicibibacter halophilus]QDI90807.1 hypothetical protein EPH95_06130 [Salicibibacter halophilus]
MFGFDDVPRLLMSAMLILPIVMFIRESGYYFVTTLLGATEKKLTIGCGPVLFQTRTIEVRRYFFMYSWMDYEELRPDSKFWHALIYAAPILSMIVIAMVVNMLIGQGVLPANTFWDIFLFYLFFYVLFETVPVYLPDGQPTNGRALFDLFWHGESSDFSKLDADTESGPMQHVSNDGSQTHSSEEASTQAQKETMENMERDQQERDDHTQPETSDDNQRSYTEAQEETMQNRDRDYQERKDRTDVK